jgi:hypothetical protein
VNQALNFQREFHIPTTIETLARPAFIGFELGEFCFPEPQDVGFDATDAGYVTYLEVEAVGDDGRVDSAFSGEL